MAKAATQQEQTSLVTSTAKELGFTDSYLQLVKDVYAKNATDEELALFIRTAHRLGLDPTARQIYLVKRWDGGLKREVATPQTSIDGFRLIADRTDKYVPGRQATYEYADSELLSATAFIKKFAGGEWHEISATAFYDEYVQKTKEGKPNSMWSKMPHLMLAKCAEALALRKAFPAELSGIYTSEEMGHSDYQQPSPPTKGQLIEAAKADTPEDDVSDADVLRANYRLRITDLCKELNMAGDSIEWKPSRLDEYINEMFEVDDGIKSLTFESLDVLEADLQMRLDELKAV